MSKKIKDLRWFERTVTLGLTKVGYPGGPIVIPVELYEHDFVGVKRNGEEIICAYNHGWHTIAEHFVTPIELPIDFILVDGMLGMIINDCVWFWQHNGSFVDRTELSSIESKEYVKCYLCPADPQELKAGQWYMSVYYGVIKKESYYEMYMSSKNSLSFDSDGFAQVGPSKILKRRIKKGEQIYIVKHG